MDGSCIQPRRMRSASVVRPQELKFFTMENVGSGDEHAGQKCTTSYWITIRAPCTRSSIFANRTTEWTVWSGLCAGAPGLRFLMCDRRDIGSAVEGGDGTDIGGPAGSEGREAAYRRTGRRVRR